MDFFFCLFAMLCGGSSGPKAPHEPVVIIVD